MQNTNNSLNNTRKMVFTALMFAIALVLSYFEQNLPPLIPVQGVKPGFSNIIVMYALFFIGTKEAYSIAVLKSVFVLLQRGFMASAFSFSGGVLSVTIMLILRFIFKDKISYMVLSVVGAITHNIAQFITAKLIYQSLGIIAMLPQLIIFGVIMGVVTATILKFIFPVLNKLGLYKIAKAKNSQEEL